MYTEMNIRKIILDQLKEKLARFGVSEHEITERFDLVKSGLVSSLEFVNLIATMEKLLNAEIDYETALQADDFTTVAGLIRTFENHINEGF
jgi:acyl carrier protein